MEEKSKSSRIKLLNQMYEFFHYKEKDQEEQSEKDVFTVDEAINRMGFGPFQILITVFCGLIWVADAMELMILAILSPIVKCQWDLTSMEEALITSVVFLGLMVGVFFWGLLNDIIGRKFSLLLVDICVLLCGLLSAVPVSADDGRKYGYPWLLFWRFGVGFSSGGTMQVVTYYAEFLPQKGRGIWLVVIAMWWTVGGIFCSVLAMLVLGVWHLNWHWFLGMCATPMGMVLLLFPLVPESARFYLVKGKSKKAIRVLDYVAKVNCQKLPMGKLVLQEEKSDSETDAEVGKGDSIPESSVSQDLSDGKLNKDQETSSEYECGEVETEEAVGEDKQMDEEMKLLQGCQQQTGGRPSKWNKKASRFADVGKKFSVLFANRMWMTTFLLFFIWFGGAWSYYGVVILTTSLLSSDPHCGIEDSRGNSSSACRVLDTGDYAKILYESLAEFPGLILTFVIIELIGRKKTMAVEFLMAAGAFLLLLICASKMVLTAFLFIVRAFVAGVFQVAFVYTPEVYPTEVRALGLGVCNMAARVGGILTPIVGQVLFYANSYISIGLYAGSCVVFSILSMLLPIETKGRPLQDK